jgi:amidase
MPKISPWLRYKRANQRLGAENKIDRRVYLQTKLSIQVVAPKLQDHRLCQVMEIIDKALQSRVKSGQAKL